LFTGKYAQLVVMCLQPGEEIGNEVHTNVDQFFRIEQGEAAFVFSGSEKHLVKDGDAVIVSAGTYHNVINASKTTGFQSNISGKNVKIAQKTANAAIGQEMSRLVEALSNLASELRSTTPNKKRIDAILDFLKQSWVPNAITSIVASIITKMPLG